MQPTHKSKTESSVAIELAICKTILERGHEKWNGKHQADGRGGDGVFV